MDRVTAEELLDRQVWPIEDVASSLRDIQRVNRFLAGTWVIKTHLRRFLRQYPIGSTLTLLDIATGSGDIPRAIIRWGKRQGYHLRYTCLDIHPTVLEVARQQSVGYEMEFICGDAREIDLRDGAFDVVTHSMSLHHFEPGDAVRILREMDRLSRRGMIVNDLRRSRWAWAGIWALTRLCRVHPLTRHDGPLSTLRAYTPRELREMAHEAGLRKPRIYKHPFYRMALVVDKTSEGAGG